MTTIDLAVLSTVTGGASKSSELTQTLTQIQSSIHDLSASNKNQSSNLLLPVMMFAMQRKQQSTVVTGGGATVVA